MQLVVIAQAFAGDGQRRADKSASRKSGSRFSVRTRDKPTTQSGMMIRRKIIPLQAAQGVPMS